MWEKVTERERERHIPIASTGSQKNAVSKCSRDSANSSGWKWTFCCDLEAACATRILILTILWKLAKLILDQPCWLFSMWANGLRGDQPIQQAHGHWFVSGLAWKEVTERGWNSSAPLKLEGYRHAYRGFKYPRSWSRYTQKLMRFEEMEYMK